MNADEIVRVLREAKELPTDFVMHAADLIKSLQAQLKESQEEAKKQHYLAFEMAGRADEAQRRERAAVEDLKNIVDAVREAHCDGTYCFACKYDADFSIGESGNYLNECPGFDRDDCFEWRGPQAEEGEAE